VAGTAPQTADARAPRRQANHRTLRRCYVDAMVVGNVGEAEARETSRQVQQMMQDTGCSPVLPSQVGA